MQSALLYDVEICLLKKLPLSPYDNYLLLNVQLRVTVHSKGFFVTSTEKKGKESFCKIYLKEKSVYQNGRT